MVVRSSRVRSAFLLLGSLALAVGGLSFGVLATPRNSGRVVVTVSCGYKFVEGIRPLAGVRGFARQPDGV